MLKVKYFGRPSIIIDNERWRARINLLMFVYTRPEPIYFHTVTPEVVEEFRKTLQQPVSTSHTRKLSRIPELIKEFRKTLQPPTPPSYIRKLSPIPEPIK